MDEVYQKLTDRTRVPLALKQVKTIFGFSHRPHQIAKRGRERTEVFKAVQAQTYVCLPIMPSERSADGDRRAK